MEGSYGDMGGKQKIGREQGGMQRRTWSYGRETCRYGRRTSRYGREKWSYLRETWRYGTGT